MSNETVNERLGAALERLRRARPLIHHITNFVVMNDTANVTLLVGASPVMAHALEEVEEMVSMAGALVLNPGTLDAGWIEAMRRAGAYARGRGTPIVLDPVGAGATRLRTRADLELLQEVHPAVVRGNAGEIGALSGSGGEVRGVDSVGQLTDPASAVRRAAAAWGAVVAVTGRRDRISDGERTLLVDNGHEWLTCLTGTGCMSTALVGAFVAVEPDHLIATAAALASFGVAAERAAEATQGPGTFKSALFDELFRLTPDDLAARARVEVAE